MKVMIVDDAAFMRMMLRTMLVEAGYEVVGEAASGKEAVNIYSVVLPDLVTMDITMPDMDGIEAVKQIKKKDPNAKIVMCSAMGQQGMVLEAIQAGAKDFIVKPFQKDRVLAALNKALGIKVVDEVI
jgi:two-component system chemotaxis response regulator CheY